MGHVHGDPSGYYGGKSGLQGQSPRMHILVYLHYTSYYGRNLLARSIPQNTHRSLTAVSCCYAAAHQACPPVLAVTTCLIIYKTQISPCIFQHESQPDHLWVHRHVLHAISVYRKVVNANRPRPNGPPCVYTIATSHPSANKVSSNWAPSGRLPKGADGTEVQTNTNKPPCTLYHVRDRADWIS